MTERLPAPKIFSAAFAWTLIIIPLCQQYLQTECNLLVIQDVQRGQPPFSGPRRQTRTASRRSSIWWLTGTHMPHVVMTSDCGASYPIVRPDQLLVGIICRSSLPHIHFSQRCDHPRVSGLLFPAGTSTYKTLQTHLFPGRARLRFVARSCIALLLSTYDVPATESKCDQFAQIMLAILKYTF